MQYVTWKPYSGVSINVIDIFCNIRSCLERDKPMPFPEGFVVKKGTNMSRRTSGGIGAPSLLIVRDPPQPSL